MRYDRNQLSLTLWLQPGFIGTAVLSLMGVDKSAGYKCMGWGGFQLLPVAMASLMNWKGS